MTCIDIGLVKQRIIAIVMVMSMAIPYSELYAVTQSFYQSFDSQVTVASEGGSCTTNCLFVNSGRFESAINFNNPGNPVYFNVLNQAQTKRLSPIKGTISFWYKPSVDSSYAKSRSLFKLGKDDSDEQDLFKVGIYYNGNKHYLYFRHDGDTGCGGTTGISCSREVSTSAAEPSVVMAWKIGEWHKITVSWDFSSTQHYMAMDVDGVYSNVNQGLNEAVTTTNFNPIDFHLGGWHTTYNDLEAKGMIDELKIYSESILDPDNSINSYIESTRNDTILNAHETVYDSTDAPLIPASLVGKGLAFYTNAINGGYFPIYEGSVPVVSGDPGSQSTIFTAATPLNIKIAKNEYETAYVGLFSTKNMGVSTGVISNLSSASGAIISSNNVNLRIVKNWFQSGRTPTNTYYPVYTPELLVEDDAASIQCGNVADTNFKDGVSDCTASLLPSIPRNTGSIKTLLNANISKQLAMTVNVPENQEPGIYQGDITVSTENGETYSLPVEVEILNFVLEKPEKIISIYYPGYNPDSVIRQSELANMAAHGINGALFYGSDASWPSLTPSLGMNKFAGYIVNSTNDAIMSNLANALVLNGYEPFLYGQDEPYLSTSSMVEHLKKSKAIHAITTNTGGKGLVTTAVLKETAEGLNTETSEYYTDSKYGGPYTLAEAHLDLANLNVYNKSSVVTRSYFSGLLNKTIQPTTYPGIPNYQETYYWQVMQEDPRINRYYAGVHLWLTNLAGIFPYIYQDIRGNPYDDFKIWSGTYRDHLVTYPSQQGPVDTVQWEGFRDGVNDFRLLQTWQSWNIQLSWYDPLLASSHQSQLEAQISMFRDADGKMFTAMYNGGFTLANTAFSAMKEWVMNDILVMKQILDPDGDGINLPVDNCAALENPNQLDADGDGLGNVCDIETLTWSAISVEDGYATESGAGSNIGGSVNTTSSTMIVGDTSNKKEYKAFVSVGGNQIPANARVSSASLVLYKTATVNSPTSLSVMSAFAAVPSFGAAGLTKSDFQASPTVSASCGAVNQVSHLLLFSQECANALVGATRIQLRLGYPDNNNNSNADYFSYGTGNNSTASKRPSLTVLYTLPD